LPLFRRTDLHKGLAYVVRPHCVSYVSKENRFTVLCLHWFESSVETDSFNYSATTDDLS